ncbi:hypothetical protein C8R46DRAFT_974988 [Mycena filopes]|nr:hypothetical protein C8R46DRAFT_974988 [Mycena filopes]
MTTPSPPSPSPTPAPAFIPMFPFAGAPGTDTILRSSDGVDFHIHRAILSLVSPVFETMFRLPQAESSPSVPVIDLQEDAVALDRALRLFYPGAEPLALTLESGLDGLHETIQVVLVKYDMQVVVPVVKHQVQRFLPTHPTEVYALAVEHRWKDLAVSAAKESLKVSTRIPSPTPPLALMQINAGAYHHLLRYHYLCSVAAYSSTTVIRWIPFPNEFVWFSCGNCAAAPSNWYLGSDGIAHLTRKWFVEFLADVGALLLQTPVTNILESKAMYDALSKASQCSNCRSKVFQQLKDFVVTQWMPKITTLTNAVELQF